MSPLVFWWYALLCGAAVVNFVLYALTLRRPLSTQPERRAYERALRALAAPMVVQCAWRGVFPSLYLFRFTFWDTPLNSILVDRTFACVGELSWQAMIALSIMHIDGEQTKGGTRWVRFTAAVFVFGVYVLAEATSYYNTATTNELWAAVEVVLDATADALAIPAAIALWCRLPAGERLRSSAGVFTLLFTIFAVGYSAYNLGVDAPMYMRRYHADQAAHKHYFPFVAGLRDAAVRRVPTHRVADWREDMTWMAIYFVANPLAAIVVARVAPTIHKPCCGATSSKSVAPGADKPFLVAP